MKLAIKLFLVGLFFLCNEDLNAQVPGYLGKRLSIEYTSELGLTLRGVTQNNTGYGDVLREKEDYSGKTLGVSYNHNGRLSYVISRQKSIGIQVSQYFTGLTTEMTSTSLINPEKSNTHYNFHRLNVKSLGLIYNSFFKERGALAPLGSYYNLGIEKIWVTGEILDRLVYDGSQRISEYNLLNIDQRYSFHAFSLGFGNTQVFYDRLLVRFGAVLRIAFLKEGGMDALRGSYYTDERHFNNTDPNQVVFEMDTFQRLFSHNFMKLEIGFGILL